MFSVRTPHVQRELDKHVSTWSEPPTGRRSTAEMTVDRLVPTFSWRTIRMLRW